MDWNFCSILRYYMRYFEDWAMVPRGTFTAIAMQESSFNPQTCDFRNVCNSSSACGLMQLKPIALADIKRIYKIDLDPMNPIHSIVGAACMFRINRMYIFQRLGVNPDFASLIAAYHGGWSVGYKLATGRAIDNDSRYYLARVGGFYNAIA